MKINKLLPLGDEKQFYDEVKLLLNEARIKTYQSVNNMMIQTYWQIGKKIVEQEQKGNERANYGEFLIVNLSKYLAEQFGKGFSVANLWNFRQFYLVFNDEEKLYTLCRGLSWSHIRLIMRIDNQITREYYLKEAQEQNWSVRNLEITKCDLKLKWLQLKNKWDINLKNMNTGKSNA